MSAPIYRLALWITLIEMNFQRGEIEMRDHKNDGYHVGTLKRTKRKRAKKQSCRCDLHPSHEMLVCNSLVTLLLSFNSKGLRVNVYILWNSIYICPCKFIWCSIAPLSELWRYFVVMKYMKEIAKDILGMVIFNPHMLGQKYDIFFF